MNGQKYIRPMRIRESGLLLLIFAALGILCFYSFRPALEALGLSELQAYFLSLTPVFIIMLVWAWIGFIREGHPRTWKAFATRFRLGAFNPRLLWLGLGLGLFMLALTLFYTPLNASLVNKGLVLIPAGIPAYLEPAADLPLAALHEQFSAPDVIWIIPFALLLNILGEEIFWRGYVLPRQELTHGRLTFIIHGLLWCFSHLFQYWMLPPLLILSLALSHLAQRTKSTWPGIIAHLLNNGLPVLILLLLPV